MLGGCLVGGGGCLGVGCLIEGLLIKKIQNLSWQEF